MSDLICPDCKMFAIDSFTDKNGQKKHMCPFCNWQGEPLPRKTLSLPQLRSYRDEQRKMKIQKGKNKLFFLRTYVKSPDTIIANDDVWMDLMKKLEINHLDNPEPYFFIKLKKQPSDEILNYIKAIPGVLSITIY